MRDVLLRVQHAQAGAASLRLGTAGGLLRLLRAPPAESPHRTIRPNVGTAQYYLSLTPGVWKTFATEDQTFWCCTGTGIEEYAKLTDSIYWRDDDGVYVNLFIASELDWKEEGLKLRQDTAYPESEHTAVTIINAARRPLTIRCVFPAGSARQPS
jgi:DUF1680 family protein